MKAIEINGNKIYELTQDRVIPEYLDPKRQRKIRKQDKLISNQLELIHDLSMPDLCTNISLSPDGNYLFILGGYSYRLRCYELEQMSMKFERYVDEKPNKIAFIERDYSKFVVLEGLKTLSFHSQGGIHKKVKCNEIITDIIYSNYSEKLYIPTAKGNLTMLDICSGALYNQLTPANNRGGINCASYNESTDLFLCGRRTGIVDGYDARTSSHVYSIDVGETGEVPEDLKKGYRAEVMKMAFKSPLMVGVGTDKGVVHLYDLRNNSRPWSTRDLDYRLPVRSIIFHDDRVIAAVGSVVKIWEPREGHEGDIFATYDTNKTISDFFQYPKSGLFFAATDDSKLPTYFIPRLGDAPRWCEKLSNLIVTAEVESQSMYDSHTFVTVEELDELHLKHLIGTGSLRAYTHGYYISNNTYKKAKEAIERLKMEKREESGAVGVKLFKEEVDEIEDPKMNVAIKTLSVEPRFSSFFTDSEFTVDPTSKEFERVITESNFLAKKRQKKLSKKENAIRAHKLAKMEEGSDGDDIDIESDSESD